jgi:ribulose-phosphate 3-epimerase
MSVNPGFGGQKLIPSCLNKVKNLKKTRQKSSYSYIISIDGGVNSETLPSVLEAGADLVVSGSSFFSGDLPWGKA